jgi:oligopeptide transport system permease protein
MLSYILRRLLSAIPTLFVVVTLSFFLMRLAPGGPFSAEKGLSPQVMANLKATYNLDAPLWQQYLDYLGGLLRGDLGPSYVSPDFTVRELFAIGLPVSIELGAIAMVVAIFFGCLAGILAAIYQNRLPDYAVVAASTAGSTIPNFVLAPLLQLFFGFGLKGMFDALGWQTLPIGGWENGSWRNMVLPVIVLAVPQFAIIARLMRASMIEALRSHHVRTARSLGLPGTTVILRHTLKGALLPVISYLGPAAANVLTGSIIVERIFSIPGVGRYFVESALSRDYTVVMGTVVMIAVMVIVFNLIVDILYSVLDPRVRHD